MPAAARVGDPTGHPASSARPSTDGADRRMPAATVGTPHICSFPGVVLARRAPSCRPGARPLLIGGLPARMGDLAACGAPDRGRAPTVLIGLT